MPTVLPGAGSYARPGSAVGGRRSARRGWGIAVAVVLAAGLATGVAVASASGGSGGLAVTVRSPDGGLIARVPLEGDRFAVGYRNSIYTTLAEERYRVNADGRFELVELAADQLAVLEEYYAVPDPPRPAPPGDRRNYVVVPDPSRPAVFEHLSIAATDLGERTLFVPGQPPVLIWQRVVSDDPTVILDIEENS